MRSGARRWWTNSTRRLTIIAEGITGRGVPLSQRASREEENERAIGGLRIDARAVDRVPGWKGVGLEMAKVIEKVVVDEHEDELDKNMSSLGNKVDINRVLVGLCEILREEYSFLMDAAALRPGPGACIRRGT